MGPGAKTPRPDGRRKVKAARGRSPARGTGRLLAYGPGDVTVPGPCTMFRRFPCGKAPATPATRAWAQDRGAKGPAALKASRAGPRTRWGDGARGSVPRPRLQGRMSRLGGPKRRGRAGLGRKGPRGRGAKAFFPLSIGPRVAGHGPGRSRWAAGSNRRTVPEWAGRRRTGRGRTVRPSTWEPRWPGGFGDLHPPAMAQGAHPKDPTDGDAAGQNIEAQQRPENQEGADPRRGAAFKKGPNKVRPKQAD